MKTEEALRHLKLEGKEIPDNVQGIIFLTNHAKIREWAANNACSILFIVVMFIITWILLLTTNM